MDGRFEKTAAVHCQTRPTDPVCPTREGTVEAELNTCRRLTTELGDALQELRSRLSAVLRNTPVNSAAKDRCEAANSPVQCMVASSVSSLSRDITRYIEGVKETMDLLDLN